MEIRRANFIKSNTKKLTNIYGQYLFKDNNDIIYIKKRDSTLEKVQLSDIENVYFLKEDSVLIKEIKKNNERISLDLMDNVLFEKLKIICEQGNIKEITRTVLIFIQRYSKEELLAIFNKFDFDNNLFDIVTECTCNDLNYLDIPSNLINKDMSTIIYKLEDKYSFESIVNYLKLYPNKADLFLRNMSKIISFIDIKEINFNNITEIPDSVISNLAYFDTENKGIYLENYFELLKYNKDTIKFFTELDHNMLFNLNKFNKSFLISLNENSQEYYNWLEQIHEENPKVFIKILYENSQNDFMTFFNNLLRFTHEVVKEKIKDVVFL